jgi:hypothetical protein
MALKFRERMPVPPLTGAIRIGVIAAIVCQVLLLVVAGRHNRYPMDPDTIAYIRLAWYYATGQFQLAVSGSWGPLLSWLMVPGIRWTQHLADGIGWAEHLLNIARIVMNFSAVVFVFGCVAIFRGLCLSPVALLMGTWLAALGTVFWSMEYIGADLLVNGILGLALGQMLRMRWCTSYLTPWLTGMICGVAYLAKAIALPVTVSCSIGVGALWVFSHRLPWRQVSRSVVLTWLGCALVAGPWIAVLSWKYRTLTFSRSVTINHAIVGPPDIERGHPFRRVFHKPEAGRLLAWEDPSTMPYRDWSSVQSFSYARHQLELIYDNYYRVLKILMGFDALSFGLFALVGEVLMPGSLRRRLRAEPWRWAVVPVVGLVGWYLPLHASEQRYYFLAYPLLLAASMGLALSLTHRLRDWRRGVGWIALLLVVSSFALPVLIRLPRALLGLETSGVEAHALAVKLHAAHLTGPLAGVRGREGMYVAFFLNQPWYGDERDPTLERLKSAQAMLYVVPRHSTLHFPHHSMLLAQLDADPSFRNLDSWLFAAAEEAQRSPWRVYQRLAP